MTVGPSILRNSIAAIWLLFCVADLCAILGLYAGDWIGEESLIAGLKCLNRVFVPYLGVILAYYLATRRAGEKRGRSLEYMQYLVAISASLIWNGVIFFFLALLLAGNASAEATIQHVDQSSSLLAWIAAPAIGFFFGAHRHGSS
jgi:hypothetical protein